MIGNRRSIRGFKRLRRRLGALACLALALLAAACAEDRPRRAATLGALARFADAERTAVEIVVFDVPPGVLVEEVALDGPRGERLATAHFRLATRESGEGLVVRPGIGIGVTGGSKSGVNPSLSLGSQVTGSAGDPGRQSREVSALLVLPDPAAYRDSARDWRVTVRYLDVAGTSRTITIPAPH